MKNYNPISKTYCQNENGILQHYSEWLHKCSSCGHAFLPKIHSQSSSVRFLAIFFGIAASLLFLVFFYQYYYVLILAGILYAGYYAKKERKVWGRDSSNGPRYGEIIIECPQCGSTKAEKKQKYKPI